MTWKLKYTQIVIGAQPAFETYIFNDTFVGIKVCTLKN